MIKDRHNCYFIIDDVLSNRSREGFIVMHGNPETAVGTVQGEYLTLKAARQSLHNTGESHYRVWLARRHGEHKTRYVSKDWRFKNADGSLTRYAFACGYQELTERAGVRVRLYHEGACFHVITASDTQGRIAWDCFETDELKKARAHFRAMVRKHVPKAD